MHLSFKELTFYMAIMLFQLIVRANAMEFSRDANNGPRSTEISSPLCNP